MKPANVKSSIYIDFNKENNKEDSKLNVSDLVRISKYKKIFAKDYVPNWSEEVFVIKKVKNTQLWTCVISDLNRKEIVRTFYEKELQKSNKTEFRVEKIIKRKGNRKGNKLYVKWKATIILLKVGLIKKI